MCGVVFDFGSACMDCGKTGEVGTDDLRKRDPQVEGEIAGRLSQNWKRVLPAKFAGGFLCMLGGLSLGKRKVRRSNLEPWQDRGYPELWDGEKEKRSF